VAMAAIAGADACFGRVRDAAPPDTLLIACSDHGHQTVGEVVDINAAFAAAGLEPDPEQPTLIAASNGTSALIYLHPDRARDARAVLDFLHAQPWAGAVLADHDLRAAGQAPDGGLLCAVAMHSDDRPNAFGIPGISAAARPVVGKPDRLGCGQHGGLGTYEQMPFLLIAGAGFAPATTRTTPSSMIDLAPTILAHLRLPAEGCEGQALQATASA
jgi:arylsulfatase A-like enzyme